MSGELGVGNQGRDREGGVGERGRDRGREWARECKTGREFVREREK